MLKNAERLMARLKADGLREAAGRAVLAAAERTKEAAAARAPVDTGALRGSISAVGEGLEARVSAECEYAAAVEFGTSCMPARPFMQPAAAVGREALARCAAEMAKGRLLG